MGKKQETENQVQEDEVLRGSQVEEGIEVDDQSASEEVVDESGCQNDSVDLERQIEELEKKNAELQDQYIRKVADFDNYRKRMIREKQDAFDYANTNLLSDLLESLDNFDRALDSARNATDVQSVVDGVQMTKNQLVSMLENKYNLVAYGQKGDVFDPNIHEAIGSSSGPVAEPVCLEVYLKGYKLKERVIRHAKVMVQMPDGSADVSFDKDGSVESEK